ncbi:MAG: prolyl oligopeptidase family serine peptidase [Planctomycetota bacterium]|nr:prolyl oligopeptidase family serine peptidase [Planctomycetota bacterium]
MNFGSVVLWCTFLLSFPCLGESQEKRSRDQDSITQSNGRVKKQDAQKQEGKHRKKKNKQKQVDEKKLNGEQRKKKEEQNKKASGKNSSPSGEQGKDLEASSVTLEKLFPKKSPFGPSASRASFSRDGRYAAFLYRPYRERRHGNDLYVYDFETEAMKRLTSVSVMAQFQSSTRKVEKDRITKAKKSKGLGKPQDQKAEPKVKKGESEDDKAKVKGKKDETRDKKARGKVKQEQINDQKSQELGEKLGDQVSDKDADDEKAPRYSGVTSYQWHPTAHEILFLSGGEIFHLKLDGSEPRRLTRTRDSERSVQFLPNGKGFLFMRDGKLFRVRQETSLIEQIDPALSNDEEMNSYRLSPSGTKLAIQTRKGKSPFSSDRKVKIVNYRGRFAEVREYNRVVADDPVVVQEVFIYFYDLTKHENEEAKIELVYSTKINSPRDAVSTPEWSLDSKQITFADYHFDNDNVAIYTAKFPESHAEKSDSADRPLTDNQKKDGGESQEQEKQVESPSETQEKPVAATGLAKLQYRFLHFGGPNTPRMIQPRFLKDTTQIIFVSEQSGFRHLHQLDTTYQTVAPLTQGNFEVYLEEVSKDRRYALVTSTKTSPARTMAYRVDLESREMVALTKVAGNYSGIAINQEGTRMIGNYSTFGKLTELVRVNQAAKKDVFKVLTNSHSEEAEKITKPVPEFFSYANRHGHQLHGTVFKPTGWKKTDKRPCLIYVYGGPLGTRHSVVDGSYRADSYFFAYYMAQVHGYVTVTIDPRGQSGYGALFEKSNFQQVGKPQVEDLVDGVSHLVSNYGVDKEKVGLHGWSFGGFQTQMCLYSEPEVFAAGIAGAGPTEWENYNKWYSTGTIDRSGAGKLDQKKYSLLPLAKNLKAKLLLVHGMEDSNVLYQDTVRVYRELIKTGKETLVELFLDPTGGHGLGGDVKRLGKYRKYEEFLVRTLGTFEKRKPKKK